MMKKRVVALTTAAVMALSMTACGGGGGADKTASGDKEGGLSGEITVWSWDVALAHLEEWAEKFQEENPDVTFNFEEMGVDQVYQKMTTCLQSGIGLPDIVSIEGEQMAKFGEKFPGKFEDFTDMINPDDYFPIKISECTVDGKIIAYPWDSGPCGMFYRSDLFEEAGIKAEDIVTWDDFIEAGKVLKEKTGVNMLCMAESRNDTTYRLLMMEGGGFYFDKDGNTQVDSDVSIQAMETCKKMYDAGITFNNSSWDDMVAGMGADKFACIADAVWMVGSIKEAAPDQSGKWAVMELPRFQADKEAQGASNGGSVLAVPSASKSTEASKAFVKFVMENVNIPPQNNTNLLNNPIAKKDANTIISITEIIKGYGNYLNSLDASNIVIPEQTNAVVRTRTKGYVDFTLVVAFTLTIIITSLFLGALLVK